MLAPEGRRPLGATLATATLVQLFAGTLWALPLWALVPLLAFSFWHPERPVPALPLAIISPVDGRVRSVRHTTDPWLERETLRIGIRLRWLGLSPLRCPTEGKVMDLRYAHDAYTEADFCVTPRGTAVCHALWVRTDEDDDVVLVVSSRMPFHRLVFHVHVGERVGQGQRCGFVYFGSRVDVLAPRRSRPDLTPDSRACAGASVIATLIHG